MRRRTLFALILFFSFSSSRGPVLGDIVYLQGGGTFEGEVTLKGDFYEVKRGESVMKIPKDTVERVEKKASVYKIYTEKLSGINTKDPNAYYELGVWCLSQKLGTQADEAFRDAIRLDPNHAASREKLGYKQIEGAWYVRCPDCKGTGEQRCPTCIDRKSLRRPCPNERCKNGRITCEVCGGAATFTCKSCNGRGNFYCNRCSGMGHIRRYSDYGYTDITCDICKGTGRAPCPNCKGGRIPCKGCGGKGSKLCPDCQGVGYTVVTCPDCKGTGKARCALCKGRGLVPEGTPPSPALPEVASVSTKPVEPRGGGQTAPSGPANMVQRVSPAVVSVKAFGLDKVSVGAGFVVRADGLIATNRSLVENSSQILVKFQDGKKPVKARVIQKHPSADLALLALEKPPDSQLLYLKTGDPDAVKAGDDVVAFGNPQGEEGLVSNGTVKSIKRKGATPYVYTTVSVASEGGGGPLINIKGEVVGIVAPSAADEADSGGKDRSLSSAVSVSELADMLALVE